MKNMKKVFALVLVAIMVFALSATAFAADTGSITITPPTGTPAEGQNEYKIYKVFDAVGDGTNISYKLVDGKTTAPEGFIVDDGGNVYLGTSSTTATGAAKEFKTKVNGVDTWITPQTSDLTAAQIAAIAAYVAGDQPVATATSTGTAAAVAANLPNGYYYVTTSTGSAVTVTTTNPNAQVNDKNTITPPDKKITGATYLDADGQKALAQIGTDVNYEATVTVGKGAKNYIFHDVMDSQLSYNDDVKVYIGSTEVAATNYDKTTAAGDTITVKFNDTYIAGLAEGTVLTIKYSAKITADALTLDPAKNTATLTYGDKNIVIPSPHIPEVYNAKITVVKQDGNGQALGGAGFVLAKTVIDTPAQGETPAVTHVEYYKNVNNVVSWVTDIAQATEYTTEVVNGVASVAFAGLADGTYTLIEKTVPTSYNKAPDQTITIAGGNYTAANLEQSTTVINNPGTPLPSTGGIGTTIFYVLGAMLMAGAVVLLVTKKRVGNVK